MQSSDNTSIGQKGRLPSHLILHISKGEIFNLIPLESDDFTTPIETSVKEKQETDRHIHVAPEAEGKNGGRNRYK